MSGDAGADDAPFPGVRPMTDVESNLMTQVLDLRHKNGELLAEVEKLRRGGKELGRIIERQCLDVLEITGMHHVIDADGDGDWGLVWERLAEMAAAGAEVEKLRGALETIRGHCTDLSKSCTTSIGDILADIERAGIEP